MPTNSLSKTRNAINAIKADQAWLYNLRRLVPAILASSAVSFLPATVVAAESATSPEMQSAASSTSLIPSAKGWNCLSTEGDSWDCNLQGPDPKDIPEKGIITRVKNALLPIDDSDTEQNEESVVSLIKKEDRGLGIIALDSHVAQFDREDEEEFATLQEFAGTETWGTCNAMMGPPAPVDKWDDSLATYIEADYTEVYEQDIATFSGDVELTRGNQRMHANNATYDRTAETISGQGEVRYREPGITFSSDRMFMKQKTGEARLQETRFMLENIPARGRAGTTYRDSPTVTRFRQAAYTTCQPGNQDWVLGAEFLKLDRGRGIGTARHAWLRLKDVPVFYTPYLSFPLDDRRKSGFLAPSMGSNDETGFDAAVPYYWNIAPNMDATFTPRYLSKRGAILGAEFRYLNSWSNSVLSGEFMPNDSERDEMRGQFSIVNQTRFDQYLTSNMDVNFVSDDEYLDEMGNTLSFSNQSHVRSFARIAYNRWGMSLSTFVENWQTIDDAISSNQQPYKRLPQVDFSVHDREIGGGLFAGLSSQFVYFDHSHLTSAKRVNIKPSISYPMKTSYGYMTPKFSLQHTQYWYDSNDESNANKNVDSSDSRTLPIVSVDSGLFFERDTDLFGESYTQTLEPRAYYLYVPTDDQDDIPVFDTALYDFSFYQMFRENRFSGTDRINDANQLTLAMTSRLIDDKTGLERFRGSLGTIFYFKDLEVMLPGYEDYTDSSSNVVGEVFTQLTDKWSFRSTVQWNPHSSDGDRRQFALNYANTTEKLFNIAYRYRKDTIEQVDGSFKWPIPYVKNWSGVGRWQYSLRDNLTLDSLMGLERESCCWRFRIVGRHYANDGSRESNTGIYVQLELKGFTSFGDKVDEFLEQSITGYRRPEY